GGGDLPFDGHGDDVVGGGMELVHGGSLVWSGRPVCPFRRGPRVDAAARRELASALPRMAPSRHSGDTSHFRGGGRRWPRARRAAGGGRRRLRWDWWRSRRGPWPGCGDRNCPATRSYADRWCTTWSPP